MNQPTTPNTVEALQLAMDICDAIPTRLHLSEDETLARIGRLVNAQPNGGHGYAVIRGALAEVLADRAQRPITASPAAVDGLVNPPSRAEPASIVDAGVSTWQERYAQAEWPPVYTEKQAMQDEIAELRAVLATRFRAAGRNAQPEQPASPTVAGSVDTPEFRQLTFAYAVAITQGSVPESSKAWGELVDYINARLAPAAPSGEATTVRKAFICTNCDCVYADQTVSQCDCMPERDEFIEGAITYPAPSSPTALGLPAQAVPELAKWIDDAKGKDPFTDDLIAEIEQLRAQVAANKQEGK